MKLNKQEFTSALQKGLGRAFLYVHEYGLTDTDDIFLQACLHNQTYDPQAEGSRAKWLFSMYRNTEYYQTFNGFILDALAKETETWSLQQLFEIAKEIAVTGNKQAYFKIRDRALKIALNPTSDDWLGAPEWIEIGGNAGFLELIRCYGQRLIANPDDFVPEHEIFPEYTITEEYKNLLSAYARREPEVKAYLDYINTRQSSQRKSSNLAIAMTKTTREEIQKRQRERIRAEFSVDHIINLARNKDGDYPGHYSSFGRYATKEELEAIYDEFLKEKDDDVRLRLLWVFGHVQIPFIDNILFELANGNNERLKAAALRALAQISDTRVHEFGKKKVKEKLILGFNSNVLDIFIKNYSAEDAGLITKTILSMQPERDDLHSLGMGINDIAKNNKDIALADILRWNYNHTPCSGCRNRTVVELEALHLLNSEILYECQFDSNEAIRKLANSKTGLADCCKL